MAEEKNKTAMQDVIKKMCDAKDNFPALGFDDEFVRGFNKAFQMAVLIASKIGIEKEKEQIKKAFHAGRDREYEAHFGPVPPKLPSADNYIKCLYE